MQFPSTSKRQRSVGNTALQNFRACLQLMANKGVWNDNEEKSGMWSGHDGSFNMESRMQMGYSCSNDK